MVFLRYKFFLGALFMAGLLLSGGSVFSQDVNIFGQLSSSDDDEEEEILHIRFF